MAWENVLCIKLSLKNQDNLFRHTYLHIHTFKSDSFSQ